MAKQVVMFLFKSGGNLDKLNNDGFTPVAFGSQKLLSFLSLEKATSFVIRLPNQDNDIHNSPNDPQEIQGPTQKSNNGLMMTSKIFGKSTASEKEVYIHKKTESLEPNNEN